MGLRAAVRRREAVYKDGGIVATILGGWQTAGTFEYQPGALLDWGNIFFYGNLDDIRIDHPQIALRPDGTVDPTKRWFNIDAGFERDPARRRPSSRNGSSRSASTGCADSTSRS